MRTLISPENHAALWAFIAGGTALAIWMEQRFRWAARLSAPVIALLVAMMLANARVVPTSALAYDFVGDWLVPLAIPLLLLRANLRAIFRTGGRLLVAFHISSIGTLLGVALAVLTLRRWIPPPNLEHAAGMMTGSYIGGSVNFLAVKASYDVRPGVADPLIVADNFVMAAMFVALLAIAASRWFGKRFRLSQAGVESTAAGSNSAAEHWQRKGISLGDIAWSFAFAFVVVGLASWLGQGITALFDGATVSGGGQILSVLLTNRFVLITGLTLTLATFLSGPLAKIQGSEELGTYLLLLFLFTLGLPADLVGVLTKAPLFFVFCGIIALVNLGFTLLAGRLFRLPLEELLVAVNANLGGAPSAAAMAISAGWPRLVLPGVIVGIWGYVIGTPIGVLVVEWMRR
ncbi:MAG: DUF819 family protein [Chthoniobacteraceae bacterium]